MILISWVRARIQVCILRTVSLCRRDQELNGSQASKKMDQPSLNLKSVELCSNSAYQLPCLEESILKLMVIHFLMPGQLSAVLI